MSKLTELRRELTSKKEELKTAPDNEQLQKDVQRLEATLTHKETRFNRKGYKPETMLKYTQWSNVSQTVATQFITQNLLDPIVLYSSLAGANKDPNAPREKTPPVFTASFRTSSTTQTIECDDHGEITGIRTHFRYEVPAQYFTEMIDIEHCKPMGSSVVFEGSFLAKPVEGLTEQDSMGISLSEFSVKRTLVHHDVVAQ